MKHYRNLLSLLVFFSLGIYAADNSDDRSENNSTESTGQAEVVPEGVEKPLEETITDSGNEIILDTTDENFVPSEQITEDLPVAFPVDI